MSTELPADRLQRRLDGRSNDDDASDDDDSSALLSRWLPQTPSSTTPWWTSIRADPGRAGALALGAVAVVAVAVSVFTLTTSDTPPVVAANLPPVETVSTPAASTAQPDTPVVVSVVGLVHTPGLVTLTPGARIADALAAAGGAQDGADIVGLNIAQRVSDGQQIVVGIAPAPGQPAGLGSSVSPGTEPGQEVGTDAPQVDTPGAQLDLNTATAADLEELPGIGPVTAAAILTWRDANGPFTSVDQLAEVDGIGPARLDKLRDQVRV